MNQKIQNYFFIYSSILIISSLHYYTSTGQHYFHDIYRRLYYIPIIFSAFFYGVKGGLISSLCISLIYAPHAFWHGVHLDPAGTLEKALEIALYNIVAVVTGALATREKNEKERHRQTALNLEASISELKKKEDELLRAQKLSALGQLTAGLAHEIRNPLGSIQGSAEILSADYSPGDKKYKISQILIKEAHRLNEVLTSFLSFAGPQPIKPARINILKELEGVIKLMEPQANGVGVKLEKDFQDTIPSVFIDRQRLRQVFINLIINAIQAMPRGGRLSISAQATVKEDKDFVRIDFIDTGEGISPENLPHIFNPFFTTKTEGAGLGLAISYKIVEEHQGNIKVRSSVGQGSIFTINLPL